MAEKQDRVLIIDDDAAERTTLVESALEPFGYRVQAAADGTRGLAAIRAETPDVVILDLEMAGLSGRDVLAALSAQGVDVPVILLVNEGREREALQAFRLGASDYVVRPVREAELIQAVERALKQVRLRREREALLAEVQAAARQTERHLNDLRTLMGIGRAITSLRAAENIFNALTRAAAEVTGAESAGFFLREDTAGPLVLRAGYRLPAALGERVGQPVEDDLASLVMSSKETYVGSGEGLHRFSPAHGSATSLIYAPLVVHDAAVGLLWVANERQSFRAHARDLMTALADYAAIAVMNARLFAAMEQRTRQLEAAARQAPGAPPPDNRCTELAASLRTPLIDVLNTMNMFRTGEMGTLRQSHRAAVDVMHRQLSEMLAFVEQMDEPGSAAPHTPPRPVEG